MEINFDFEGVMESRGGDTIQFPRGNGLRKVGVTETTEIIGGKKCMC
jgi:hypothetical protein